MKKPISLQKAIQRKYMALTLTFTLITLGIVLAFYFVGHMRFSASLENFVVSQASTILEYHNRYTLELQKHQSTFLASLLRKADRIKETAPQEMPLSNLLLRGVASFSSETLQSLSGKEVHLYRISPEGTIVESTRSQDLGLDLSGYPKFMKTLHSLGMGEVLLEEPVPATVGGKLTWYAYLRQENGSFLEASLSAEGYRMEETLKVLQKLPLVRKIALYHYPTLLPAKEGTPLLGEEQLSLLQPLLAKERSVLSLRKGIFTQEIFFFWENPQKSIPSEDRNLIGRWIVHLQIDSLWPQRIFLFVLTLSGSLFLAGFLFSLQGKGLVRGIREPLETILEKMDFLSKHKGSPDLDRLFSAPVAPSGIEEMQQLFRGFEKMTLQMTSAFAEQEEALRKERETARRLDKILNATMDLTEAISSNSESFPATALKSAISLVPEAEYGAITEIDKNLCQFRAVYNPSGKENLQPERLLFPHSRERESTPAILQEKSYADTLSSSLSDTIRTKLQNQLPLSRETLVKPLFFGTQCAGELILGISEGSSHKSFSKQSLRAVEALGNTLVAFLGLGNFIKSQELFQKELLLTITGILEAHDPYTQGHSESVAFLGAQIARTLDFSEKEIQKTYWAGLVHDIGKILIPKEILNKPSALSSEEYTLIQEHPALGHAMLIKTERLEEIASFVLCHHERWDGKGYPQGLEKETIPPIARILSIADAWDAMTSERSYRKALPREKALEEISRGRGTQFDPQVAEAFLSLLESPLPIWENSFST